MAESLGVGGHLRFVNEYLSLAELLTHLQACDVYVTPYPGKDQIASGTLAYALAAGGAVVSTPYLYAEEVLADGRGLLVPFGQSAGNGGRRAQIPGRFRLPVGNATQGLPVSRRMFWPNVGLKYLDLFTRISSAEGADLAPSHRKGPVMRTAFQGACEVVGPGDGRGGVHIQHDGGGERH